MHADATREVDERVAVDVGDRAARRLGGEDREVDEKRPRDRVPLALEDLARARAGDLGADVDRSGHGHGAERSRAVGRVRSPRWTPPTSIPTHSCSSRAGSAEARAAGIVHAEAMALATATAGRRPIREDGARSRAATRAGSRSSRTSRAARRSSWPRTRAPPCVLYWQPLDRQVRRRRQRSQHALEERGAGVLRHAAARQPARRLGLTAVTASRRPRASSSACFAEVEQRFAGVEDPPLPPHWGGYLLVAGRVRVLAEPAEPAPRPHPLRARRRAAGAASGSRRRRARLVIYGAGASAAFVYRPAAFQSR